MEFISPEEYPKIDVSNGSVLLVDDNVAIRSSIRAQLSEGGLFTRFYEAENGLEAFKVLANEMHQLDLILCDLEMPEFDGFKFLQMQGTRDDFKSVPVIIITSRDEPEMRIRGLNLGAADYLIKPVEKEELRLRAKHQLQIRRLQESLRSAIRELSHASKTDALTGLANRRAFMDALDAEYNRAERYDGVLSLILMDIDDFKQVNDTRGHLAGDAVLKGVSRVLQQGLRQSDLAARFGGEEFAVLLPETDVDAAVAVAERYRRDIEKLVVDFEEMPVTVTISAGVAAYPSTTEVDVEDLLRKADNALYVAKETGKNMTARAT